jgi:hypothetical protein
MGTARDIALIFLSLQAMVIALVPLAIFGALTYGVYKLVGLTRKYLRKAQVFAQQAHYAVERASRAVAAPFIKAHAAWEAAGAILHGLNRRVR